MKEWAARLWGWIWSHKKWSFVMLIVLLVGIWFGTSWTINLVRFGLPPPTGQNCGSLQHNDFPPQDGTTRADVTLHSLTCFWQEYQVCQAATASQTYAGTDAGYTDTLTIELRNNHCAIYGQEESWANTNSRTVTFLCTQLSKEGETLQVSACDGIDSFALVPRNPIYESYNCDMVDFTASYAYQIPDMEACFFTAYQQCLADSLAYRTTMNGVTTERDFYIDNHCGIAYSRGYAPPSYDAKLAACASLTMRADGLHFSQCGTDGDIFVPSDPSPSS